MRLFLLDFRRFRSPYRRPPLDVIGVTCGILTVADPFFDFLHFFWDFDRRFWTIDEAFYELWVYVVLGLAGDVHCEGRDLLVDYVFFFSEQSEDADQFCLGQSFHGFFTEGVLVEEACECTWVYEKEPMARTPSPINVVLVFILQGYNCDNNNMPDNIIKEFKERL